MPSPQYPKSRERQGLFFFWLHRVVCLLPLGLIAAEPDGRETEVPAHLCQVVVDTLGVVLLTVFGLFGGGVVQGRCVALHLPIPTYTANSTWVPTGAVIEGAGLHTPTPRVRASSKVPRWPEQNCRLDYNILNQDQAGLTGCLSQQIKNLCKPVRCDFFTGASNTARPPRAPGSRQVSAVLSLLGVARMVAKWPWVKNPGSSAVWTLDLPRLPAVSSLPAGRVSFCSATATLELFHLLPWYSTTAWDGRMQLPRGSLTPKTDFGYHKTGLRSANAGFCCIWHLYLQVCRFVRHRPTINRAAVLQCAATGLSRATGDGRHPWPDPITVPVPVSGPGSLVPIRSINGVRYTAHALHKQVPGIAARPLILQDHQPQIRLLLVITLLRNNRHACMQAREVWLVV